MEEAEELCDRVAIMDRGTIVAIDTPLALVEQLVATGFRRQVEVRDATPLVIASRLLASSMA